MLGSKTRFTLVVVTSRDGFIAAPGREVPAHWASAEEQRCFLQTVDGLDWAFMGRRTHAAAWRSDRRRVVFSKAFGSPEWRHPRHLWVDPDRVSLAATIERLEAIHPAVNCGILGGVAVHDWFLRHGLIDAVDLTIEPLDFGQGLPLFSGTAGLDPRQVLEDLGLRQTEVVALNAQDSLFCRFVRPEAAA